MIRKPATVIVQVVTTKVLCPVASSLRNTGRQPPPYIGQTD